MGRTGGFGGCRAVVAGSIGPWRPGIWGGGPFEGVDGVFVQITYGRRA